MIVLDTHIWLWWVNGNTAALGEKRKEMVDAADVAVVSTISCFEVAWLEAHGRIELLCDRTSWFEKALQGSEITLLPITPEIAGKGRGPSRASHGPSRQAYYCHCLDP